MGLFPSALIRKHIAAWVVYACVLALVRAFLRACAFLFVSIISCALTLLQICRGSLSGVTFFNVFLICRGCLSGVSTFLTFFLICRGCLSGVSTFTARRWPTAGSPKAETDRTTDRQRDGRTDGQGNWLRMHLSKLCFIILHSQKTRLRFACRLMAPRPPL